MDTTGWAKASTSGNTLPPEHCGGLAMSYPKFEESFKLAGKPLPVNRGQHQKLRELDCAVINDCLRRLASRRIPFDTVRGAFLEGPPIFAGTTISAETHIQIAVRNVDCLLGIFRPNLREEPSNARADD